MNWFQENKFLAGFLAVLIAALAGAGFYFSIGLSHHRTADTGYVAAKGKLLALKRRPLYPNQENVDLIKESVQGYKASVHALQEGLLKFQKPIPEGIKNTTFQQTLNERVGRVQTAAAAKNVTLPGDFYMGMGEYRARPPYKDGVGHLSYQLDAIEHLMSMLIRSEVPVDKLVDFRREPMAIESEGYEAPQEAPVLEKYPMELVASGSHESIRSFFNLLSNDKEFFYIIRFMRVENSAKDGPAQGSGSDPGAAGGLPGIENFDFLDADGNEAGDAAPVYDAKIVLGMEQIQVYMVIDLVRFKDTK
ncbi:MAG: Amuc_1100 family pilus-like protein [Verrucomicrobiales bacterium]